METYNKDKVGKLISQGLDAVVYHYGEGEVIKFSKLTHIARSKLSLKLRHDYEVCKKYLGEYVVDTRFIETGKSHKHIEVQNFIPGNKFYLKGDLDPALTLQLKEIIVGMESMRQDGYAEIDLIGHGGIFKPYLSNIIVTPDGKLRIIDAVLIESKSAGLLGYLFHPLTLLVRIWQKKLLKPFVK